MLEGHGTDGMPEEGKSRSRYLPITQMGGYDYDTFSLACRFVEVMQSGNTKPFSRFLHCHFRKVEKIDELPGEITKYAPSPLRNFVFAAGGTEYMLQITLKGISAPPVEKIKEIGNMIG
jgi:hypothetical protein